MSSTPGKWKHRLRHMEQAAAKILQYTQGMREAEFRAHSQAVDACVWNLTVLGEAAKHIPDELREPIPAFPGGSRGIRNRIIHAYDEIDLEVIWNVAKHELPPLVPVFEKVLREAHE